MSMNYKYLAVNAGSSSLKFALFSMPEEELIVKGNIERIGEEKSIWKLSNEKETIGNGEAIVKNHSDAVNLMLSELFINNIINDVVEIKGIGHRILHGGEKYKDAVLINDEVKADINNLTKLGPLHHPSELDCIDAMEKFFPNTPMVAVFDTSFHQTIDQEHYMYPVPYEWYTNYGVRKYGFHGTSYKYITEVIKKQYNRKNLIICHIGSGASIAAIKDGVSYDTTMGLTPLDGLMMGTRCGDIDTSIIEYVEENSEKTKKQIMEELNKNSGFLGITGKNDFREVEKLAKKGDEKAILAIQMFVHSIVKYISQYYFELNGEIEAIVFTGGIGENSNLIRKLVVEKISNIMRITLDEERNNDIAGFKEYKRGPITTLDSRFPVLVEPTNEELMIMKDTYRIINEKGKVLVKC